jgi:hypothetical protein
MNKRGMELSLTVLVLIILSIIIFIGGIALVWKFFAGAEEIKGGIEKNTKDQIEALLRSGNEIVAIPINTQKVVPGREAVFGLGIRNIKPQDTSFFVRIDFAGIYDAKGKQLQVGYDESYIEQNWLGAFQESEAVDIARNQFETVPLRVRAGPNLDAYGTSPPKGTLVAFNVCVFADQPLGDCTPENRENAYDKMRQVIVDIR